MSIKDNPSIHRPQTRWVMIPSLYMTMLIVLLNQCLLGTAQSNCVPQLPEFRNQGAYSPTLLVGIQALVPTYKITCNGSLVKWGISTLRQGQHNINMQVWRPIKTSFASYSLVGTNIFNVKPTEKHKLLYLTPNQEDRIRVHEGDVLGFHLQNNVSISDDFSVQYKANVVGTSVLYRQISSPVQRINYYTLPVELLNAAPIIYTEIEAVPDNIATPGPTTTTDQSTTTSSDHSVTTPGATISQPTTTESEATSANSPTTSMPTVSQTTTATATFDDTVTTHPPTTSHTTTTGTHQPTTSTTTGTHQPTTSTTTGTHQPTTSTTTGTHQPTSSSTDTDVTPEPHSTIVSVTTTTTDKPASDNMLPLILSSTIAILLGVICITLTMIALVIGCKNNRVSDTRTGVIERTLTQKNSDCDDYEYTRAVIIPPPIPIEMRTRIEVPLEDNPIYEHLPSCASSAHEYETPMSTLDRSAALLASNGYDSPNRFIGYNRGHTYENI